LQKLVVGGPTYGHATLTRFFALHAGVLPALLTMFLAMHIAVFRRHGIHAVGADKRPAQKFWPDQVLKDAVACLVVLLVILFFVVRGGFVTPAEGQPIQSQLGAELGAPADPSNPYSAARPEWYFLFLFQFLKYFHGAAEIFGAIVIPGLVMLVLFFMPILARWKYGHRLNVGFIVVLGICVAGLTFVAVREDRNDADYEQALEFAHEEAARVVELAQSPTGIPQAGAMFLLRQDAKTQGPILFERHCASCHAHEPPGGGDEHNRHSIASRNPSAPDLWKFGGRDWIAGFLDPNQIDTAPRFFGDTAHKDGEMVDYIKSEFTDRDTWSKEQIDELVTALAAEADVQPIDPNDTELLAKIEAGRELIKDDDRCAQCHKFHDAGEPGLAPDLTNYRSRQWTIDFIANPAHERFYGSNNDRMPAYAKDPENPRNNILTQREIELIADWLRGVWYEPEATAEP
jgi:ubiquinol-cytochrome c reductase cytochrome b subunit